MFKIYSLLGSFRIPYGRRNCEGPGMMIMIKDQYSHHFSDGIIAKPL